MIKLRLVAAAAIAAAATLLSSGAAQAYPDGPDITITIDDSILVGGNTFRFTADAGDVNCDWTITYSEGRAPGEDATRTGSGTSISGSFKTMVVTKTFKSTLTAVCRYDDGQTTGAAGKVETSNEVTPAFFSTADSAPTLQTAMQTANASAVVTLLPKGSGEDDGALPDTGGSNLGILFLGGALILVGGGVTYAARRRHSAH